MKILNLKHLAIILATGLLAFSCSDSDDPQPNYAGQIAKTYTGSVELSVSGSAMDDYMGLGKQLEITRVTDDSVKVVLNLDYSGTHNTIETVTAGAKVTESNGTYTLTGGETTTGNVVATLNGTISDNGTDITINFTPGSMPMPITAKFSSKVATRTVSNLQVSEYNEWVYFSFEDGIVGRYFIDLSNISEDNKVDGNMVDADGKAVSESSFDWDIALHRWDIRTNGGSALNTEKTEMTDVTTIPTTGYTADIDKEIYATSAMLTGTKAPFTLNEELCKWMTVNTSQMPPVYTIHKYVYIVKTQAGKYAKIQFTDRTNDDDVSGYVTFTYEYPVE